MFDTNDIDCDINDTSLALAKYKDELICGTLVTLILCDVFGTNVGTASNPFSIMFVIVTIDELTNVDCTFEAELPVHCCASVAFIADIVFDINDGIEPVPFVIILAIVAKDALITLASNCVPAEPVICSIPVILTKPSIDAVIAGATKLPLSIILVTIANLSFMLDVKLALDVADVICVKPLTFIGLFIFQFCPLFCANIDGTALVPLFIIPSIIAKELLIEFCSVIVPPNDDVVFVKLVTLSNRSSLVIIRGVSKIVF